ncbi:hypothetical protein M0R45_019494 [Rubus argutus]|uniref:Uncharacterized protein n=1 Tax=Rubus argutus TaxID=59490 RepID=A0AAW1X8A7_RUBAR
MAVFGISGFADEGCLRSRERRRASGGEVGAAAEESKEEWEAGIHMVFFILNLVEVIAVLMTFKSFLTVRDDR